MTSSHVIGAGIHTGLGRGLAANIEALRRPPPRAPLVALPLAEAATPLPCHLLFGLPLEAIETRLEAAVLGVVAEALQASGLSSAQIEDAALVLGTSSMDISVSEAVYRRELAERAEALPLMANSCLGQLADRIRRHFGIKGQDLTVNTACTASANALMYGDLLIRGGRARHVVVLGVEIFNLITAMGFSGLELLSADGMKPFDVDRSGLVLGEACAALVIAAEPRDGGGYWLEAGANLCDTHAISAANPDGSTVAAVMREALARAGVDPAAIVAVKAHGTASLLNDEAEAAALADIFTALPPVAVLKPFIGHTFGACGLAELILFMGAAEAGFLPATPGICARPSDLGITLPQTPAPLPRGRYLLNYAGFGGNNTALILANAA